jgi:hypothetical protein
MCLNCGCMRAHDEMGKAGVNPTYEDIKRAAEANDGRRRDDRPEALRPPERDRRRKPAISLCPRGQVADPSIGR